MYPHIWVCKVANGVYKVLDGLQGFGTCTRWYLSVLIEIYGIYKDLNGWYKDLNGFE